MARVFVSYASSDRGLASEIASWLTEAGHVVWWDTDLISGDTFRAAIDRELDAAEVVIVVWTPRSVRSQWVISEADHGGRQDKLLPLRVDGVKDWQIPKPFGTLQTSRVTDRRALLVAVAHIASRGTGAPHQKDGAPLDLPTAASIDASPETRIATLLSGLAALLLGGSALAAYWSDTGASDKVNQLLLGGVVLTTLVVVGCFALCRRARNPVYQALLTSNLGNLAIHGWLLASAVAAYAFFGEIYWISLAAGSGALLSYVVLLAFQLRGAAWVLPAAQLLALVQAAGLAAHVARQFGWSAGDASWFTTHSLAFLHVVYVATGVSGAVAAVSLLVASYAFAAKPGAAIREATRSAS